MISPESTFTTACSSIFNKFKTKISSDTVEKLINKIPTYPPMIFKYIFHGGDMIQIT